MILVRFLKPERLGAMRFQEGMKAELDDELAIELAERGTVELLGQRKIANVPDGTPLPTAKRQRGFIKL